MNSWTIIKDAMTEGNRYAPGTVGRVMQVNAAADLFISIAHNLRDEKDATELFNADEEVTASLVGRSGIESLRKAGVLS
jgi:hypothetical protein